MRAIASKLLGAALVWALLPTVLPAWDGGYWILDRLEYDSHRGYYFHRSYTDGNVAHMYSRNVRSGGTIYVGADSGLPDGERLKEISYGFTENSVMVGRSHRSRLSWSTPPAKVKNGEERKITMDVSLEFLDEGDIEENLYYSVSLSRNDPRGFDNYPHPDMRDGFYDGDGFRVDKSTPSVKGKSIWPKSTPLPANLSHPGHIEMEIDITSGNNPAIRYYYKYVPDLKEVSNMASATAGEDAGDDDGGERDFEIPWIFILSTIGVVTVATLINLSRKKKKEKNEEEEDHSTFRMVLYKNFGDTLVLGEPARMVGARIEETTSQGVVRDRPDLTALISIVAVSGCAAVNLRTEGRYRAVDVAADGSTQDQAQLRFLFQGPGGMFINNIFFHVAATPVIVMEESITFAACGGKTLTMAFGINNLIGKVTDVRAEVGTECSENFNVEQPAADREIPGKYIISVTERGKTKREAGDIERYECHVTVQLDSMLEPIRASFVIYRLHLGLRMEMRALKGYLVRFDSGWNEEIPTMDPKIRKKFGESKVTFKLIVEDEEKGVAASVIPDTEPVFTFEDIQEGSLLFVDKNGKRVQNPCKLMQFKYAFRGMYDDNTVWGVIYSTAAGLFPPNRAKARVTLRVTWRGKTYEDSIEVPIISQPYVDITDNRKYSNWLNENQKRFEKLQEIKRKIEINPAFRDLFPFYYKVYAMVEGFHPDFGVYEPDYERIMKVYEEYVSGKIGHYFANESAWHTGLSQADENFNAFMATYGSMRKRWPVIGLRIALGIFTVGSSELVFTPFDALVKMQEQVNEGEDNGLKCFAMASGEVIFWEGVFYLGGEALKWAKGKLDEAGITEAAKTYFTKLKDYILSNKRVKETLDDVSQRVKDTLNDFKKLKEQFQQWKEGREAGKRLVENSGYNTANLGSKVEEAGQKAINSRTTARANANKAIRATRQKGDAVFKQTSHVAEESAKVARKDAQKIVDHFKEVMNNPTATEEEIRRATLALQGNKHAQNILRNSQSDLLRANFNAQMQEIYKEADELTIKKLSERLGIPEKDIKPWNGASGNDALELRLGKKIAADRDVTYQYRDANGDWWDIREDIMEECYAEAFFEKHYKFLPEDSKEVLKELRKYDQAVVNGETGLESYGKDLERIISKARQTEKLLDPQRVSRTFKHKCEGFISQGKSCHQQAAQLEALGMYDEAMRVRGYGEALVEEGIRQNTKQFKRILDPRIQVLNVKGVQQDYSLLYEKVSILESLGNPPPKDALPITLEEARVILHDQYGTTIEEVIDECAAAIIKVNEGL